MSEDIDEAIKTIQKTLPVGILIFGTVGNMLTLIVLTRPKTRRLSTAVFLITLTIVDLIAMWSGLLRIILTGYLKIDVRNSSSVMCKIHVFVVYASTHISSWLLVGVTVERVVCVWMPVKMHLGRNNKKTLFLTFAIIITFVLLDLHLLVGFELAPLKTDYANGTFLVCQPAISESYIMFVDDIWPWIDMTLLFLLPFCVLTVGNVLILVRVRMSKKLRRESRVEANRRSADTNTLYFLTALLITLNIVFVLCIAPITVLMIGQYTWWPKVMLTEKQRSISRLCWVIVNILVYLNYAVNFLLYIACGRKLREELKTVLSCLSFKNVHAHVRQKVPVTRSNTYSGTASMCHVQTVDILSAS